jgi:hypothetical protein
MTNQTMKQRVIGPTPLGGDGDLIIKLLLVAGLLVLTVVAVVSLPNRSLDVNNIPGASLSAFPRDGRAYFTEPYWKSAAESMASVTAAATAARPATFTQQYWDLAEASARVAAATANLSAIPQDGRAYFSEVYWHMAEESASTAGVKSLNAPPDDGRAYFTEPYWNAGE